MGMLYIGSDHGGNALKAVILKRLAEHGIACHDVGSHSNKIVRYPYYASIVAAAVSDGTAERGILICSTAIGMSLIANKYPGVRASVCTTSYMGKMTRAHNDSNILCLGGKITGDFEALEILEAWLWTPYEGGRHDISLGMIREAEAAMFNGSRWQTDDPRE